MRIRTSLLAAAFHLCLALPAWALVDNQELQSLFIKDQAARTNAGTDWSRQILIDRQHVARVRALLAEGRLRTANDYRYAANILLHGKDEKDARLAMALAATGLDLYPEEVELARMYAAGWDRMLYSMGKKQWYATQYFSSGDNQAYQLYPVEEHVTDAERLQWHGMTLEQKKAQIAKLNAERGLPVPAAKPAAQAHFARIKTLADQATMLKLLDVAPALALLWMDMSERGLPLPSPMHTKFEAESIFLQREREDALKVINKTLPLIKSGTNADACVARITGTLSAKRQLVLRVAMDCKVVPNEILQVKPDQFYQLTLDGWDEAQQNQHLRLHSVQMLAGGQ